MPKIEPLKKIMNHVLTAKTGLLVATTAKDRLVGRPVQVATVNDAGQILFYIKPFQGMMDLLFGERMVMLTFTDQTNHHHVTAKGFADCESIDTTHVVAGNPLLRDWFPKGIPDDKGVLASFEPVRLELWNKGALELEKLIQEVENSEV